MPISKRLFQFAVEYRVEIELQVAHGVAAIGEKGDLLIQLHALALKHLEKSQFGLVEPKAHAGAFLRNRVSHDHFKMSFLVIPLSNVILRASSDRPYVSYFVTTPSPSSLKNK